MNGVRFRRWASLARTLPRLGWLNLARVAAYRLLLATGLHPVLRVKSIAINGEFFASPKNMRYGFASKAWKDSTRYFDCVERPLGVDAPDWFFRPGAGSPAPGAGHSWWKSGDFDAQLGDIKDIWDISRFSWVLPLAQRASKGETDSLMRLNGWIADWLEHNPPYAGYNWKCGQETSIRVMHLAMAALILGQANEPLPALRALLRAHLARIRPTIAYAIAQDNNHGICEAAALFIGGAWLARIEGDGASHAWMDCGRAQLEERAARLIAEDGGFSMYSLMYHREFLDAMSMAEVWSRALALPRFTSRYYDKASLAALWLNTFVHPISGDAPNIGANDGTRLLPLTDTGYRDFRPAVQLACVLFCDARAYGEAGLWDETLHWLDIPMPETILPSARSAMYYQSGFAVLKSDDEDAQVYVRFPQYRFRPSHADPLHVDLWLGGRNILRGPGSYRYNAEPAWMNYFPGVAAHNTAQVDDQEAMPRLGRFLFGDWLKLDSPPVLEQMPGEQAFRACYQHSSGARHDRRVSLRRGSVLVRDALDGFERRAVVRWRLMPGDWHLSGAKLVLGNLRLTVHADHGEPVLRLVEGWEARCYGLKTPLPVLEIEVCRACAVSTRIEWSGTLCEGWS